MTHFELGFLLGAISMLLVALIGIGAGQLLGYILAEQHTRQSDEP